MRSGAVVHWCNESIVAAALNQNATTRNKTSTPLKKLANLNCSVWHPRSEHASEPSAAAGSVTGTAPSGATRHAGAADYQRALSR